MTILILNWRDPKNPNAGGAEILTQELAKRWVKAGNTVTQISAMFPYAKPQEIIDDVRFIRRGQWWSVHFFACYYYLRYLRSTTDIIIDEVHWFPFFSFLYAPKKTVLFACEVANKLFFNLFPYPIAVGWRLFEKMYLTVYKNVPTMAISKSTYNDLQKEGHKISNMIILPMGMTKPAKIKLFPKEKEPTLIYVARLNKQKGIFDVVKAFSLIKKKIPKAKLWIVGSGSEETVREVKKMFTDLNIVSSVTVFGFVTEEEKFALLSKAHLLLSASAHEGWGLTVPEAGLTKTPSIVYNIQGFCDIIEDNKDGLLVEHTPEALCNGVVRILKDKKKYTTMQNAIYKKAKTYSWENSAHISLHFLEKYRAGNR